MNLRQLESQAQELRVLGIKITQADRLLAHRLWDEECRRNIYSATKSFTACAVGFALQEGLLGLDERIADVFPEECPRESSRNLLNATVRDLLTMHLGQDRGHLMAAQRVAYSQKDWVKLSLALPFPLAPGSSFVYSNVGPYLAGILVQRRAGCNLTDYLMPRLFEPLGIYRPTWEVDPLGNSFGAGGLFLTLSELHKFGLFCRDRGAWQGTQLLDPQWIDQCTARQGDAPYGYLFWRGERNSYRADGKYGQFSIVFPEKDAVVSVTAESRCSDRILRTVYDDIWPQL